VPAAAEDGLICWNLDAVLSQLYVPILDVARFL
jgi:hypothetical protein